MARRFATVLLLSLVVCSHTARSDSPGAGAPAGDVVITTDDGNDITDWLLSVSSGMRESFLPTLADIIRKAAPEIRFRILYSGEHPQLELFRQLTAMGFTDFSRIQWVPVRSEISWWTRDFFVAGTEGSGKPVIMLHSAAHYQTVQGPVRGSGSDLLTALRDGLPYRKLDTHARLEGGAIVTGERHVFLTPTACDRAVRQGDFSDWPDFLTYLRRLYGRPVVVLDVPLDPAWEHPDLFLTPVGESTLLLGDPAMAGKIVDMAPASELLGFAGQLAAVGRKSGRLGALATADPSTLRSWIQRSPDAITERLLRQLWYLGYRVEPLPRMILRIPGTDRHLRLSFNNVILEMRGGLRTVYLPSYGFPTLDQAAREVWERHGYRVVQIDALGPALFGGSVRCLSQVFRR